MLKKSSELIREASGQLIRIQKKEELPIKTGIPHLDESLLGGIFGGQIITIAAGTGVGKTYLCQRIENAIFDNELNPSNEDNILIRCNWEMSAYGLLVRRLSQELKKPIREVIDNEFTEEEKIKANDIVVKERDERIIYSETPLTPEQFDKEIRDLLNETAPNKKVILTLDHIALVKDTKLGKKAAMDSLIEVINEIRKVHKNISFIILSQLNREIEKRMDNPRQHKPLLSDIHNSSTIAHISDVVLVITNPYLKGIENYLMIGTHNDRYEHLRKYFITPGNKTTSLLTNGLIYYFYLKIRQGDMATMKDIFVEEINSNQLKNKQEEIEDEDMLFNGGGLDFEEPAF